MAKKTYTEQDMDNSYDKGVKDGINKICKDIKVRIAKLEDKCWEGCCVTTIWKIETVIEELEKQQQNGH